MTTIKDPGLYDYDTAERIGDATPEQIAASAAAGDPGVIRIDPTTGQVLPADADRAVWPEQQSVYVLGCEQWA